MWLGAIGSNGELSRSLIAFSNRVCMKWMGRSICKGEAMPDAGGERLPII